MRSLRWLGILLAIPLAGCATGHGEWVKDGITAEERASDIAECRKVARDRDDREPYYEEVPGPSPEWWIEQYFAECMRSKGYRGVWVREEAGTAAR